MGTVILSLPQGDKNSIAVIMAEINADFTTMSPMEISLNKIALSIEIINAIAENINLPVNVFLENLLSYNPALASARPMIAIDVMITNLFSK